ncbi:MAG: radical SAM protein, partial [Armatimonadetes bacterium]|nr:radical SAM protein [Armatimonadota bacterium]
MARSTGHRGLRQRLLLGPRLHKPLHRVCRVPDVLPGTVQLGREACRTAGLEAPPVPRADGEGSDMQLQWAGDVVVVPASKGDSLFVRRDRPGWVRLNEQGTRVLLAFRDPACAVSVARHLAKDRPGDFARTYRAVRVLARECREAGILARAGSVSSDESPTSTRLASLYAELTTECNLRCRYCYVGQRRGKSLAMGLPRWRSLVREAAHLGCRSVAYSGGEPLLCELLWPLVSECTRLGMACTILTNGTLIDHPMAVKLARAG